MSRLYNDLFVFLSSAPLPIVDINVVADLLSTLQPFRCTKCHYTLDEASFHYLLAQVRILIDTMTPFQGLSWYFQSAKDSQLLYDISVRKRQK